jgi:hypothetical protein
MSREEETMDLNAELEARWAGEIEATRLREAAQDRQDQREKERLDAAYAAAGIAVDRYIAAHPLPGDKLSEPFDRSPEGRARDDARSEAADAVQYEAYVAYLAAHPLASGS